MWLLPINSLLPPEPGSAAHAKGSTILTCPHQREKDHLAGGGRGRKPWAEPQTLSSGL